MSQNSVNPEAMSPDVDDYDRPLPYRRNPAGACLLCAVPAGQQCHSYCVAVLPADEQIAHRDAVLVAQMDCALAGRPRADIAPHRRTRRLLILLALGALLACGALWASNEAKAEPIPPNCVQQPWLYNGLFGRMTTRTICDGPIQPDGTWQRARNFYAASYYKPVSCSWSRYSGSCSGGYQVAEFDTGVEKYIVTPDTILPDEPGHLG